MCKYCDPDNRKIGQGRRIESCGHGGYAYWLILDKSLRASVNSKDYKHYATIAVPINYCPHCGTKL